MKRSELTKDQLNALKEASIKIIYDSSESYIIVNTCEFKFTEPVSLNPILYGCVISSNNEDIALTTYVSDWKNIPDNDEEIIRRVMALDIDAVYMIVERELGIYLNGIYYCFEQIVEIDFNELQKKMVESKFGLNKGSK